MGDCPNPGEVKQSLQTKKGVVKNTCAAPCEENKSLYRDRSGANVCLSKEEGDKELDVQRSTDCSASGKTFMKELRLKPHDKYVWKNVCAPQCAEGKTLYGLEPMTSRCLTPDEIDIWEGKKVVAAPEATGPSIAASPKKAEPKPPSVTVEKPKALPNTSEEKRKKEQDEKRAKCTDPNSTFHESITVEEKTFSNVCVKKCKEGVEELGLTPAGKGITCKMTEAAKLNKPVKLSKEEREAKELEEKKAKCREKEGHEFKDTLEVEGKTFTNVCVKPCKPGETLALSEKGKTFSCKATDESKQLAKLAKKQLSEASKFDEYILQQSRKLQGVKLKQKVDISDAATSAYISKRMKELDKNVGDLEARLKGGERFTKDMHNEVLTKTAITEKTKPCATKELQKNQESVYVLAKLRASDAIQTSGLLVKHGTGSGKTIIGLLILIAFWNQTWKREGSDEELLWGIFLVSTAKNQMTDNNILKLAKECIKFFGTFETRFYNGRKNDAAQFVFSKEFYEAQRAEMPEADRAEMSHEAFVAVEILKRINQGLKDSFVRSESEVASDPASKEALRKFNTRRLKSNRALLTYGMVGYDFASVVWPVDRKYFKSQETRVIEEESKLIEKKTEAFLSTFMKANVTDPVRSFVRKLKAGSDVTNYVKSITDGLFPMETPLVDPKKAKSKAEWDKRIRSGTSKLYDDNSAAAVKRYERSYLGPLQDFLVTLKNGTKTALESGSVEVHERFFEILNAVGISQGENNTYTYTPPTERLEYVDFAEDEEDEDAEAQSSDDESVFDEENDSVKKNTFDDEGLYIQMNERRQMQHCVFVLDEVQQMFNVPAKEAARKLDYEKCQFALKYYRDPETTWVVCLTATPGSTPAEVSEIMNMVSGAPDTYVPQSAVKTKVLPRFETVTVDINGEVKTYETVQEPGSLKYEGAQLPFYEKPTQELPFYRLRIRKTFSDSPQVLKEIEGISDALVSYVDYSGDSNRYAKLQVVAKLIPHSDDYVENYSDKLDGYLKLLEEFRTAKSPAAWGKSSKTKQRELYNKFSQYHGYFGLCADGDRLKPMKAFEEECGEVHIVPKAKRMLFFRKMNCYLEIESSGETEANEFDVVKANQMKTKIVPSNKLVGLVCDVLRNVGFRPPKKERDPDSPSDDGSQPLLKGFDLTQKPAVGKHYVYASDPRALFVVAHFLYTATGQKLRPYVGQTLTELLEAKKGNVRFFYFTDDKSSVLKPFAEAAPPNRDIASGLKLATGYTTFRDYIKAHPAEADYLNEYLKDKDPNSAINVHGDLIPIVLATSESYKGVDMAAITNLYLLDSFLDMQDLLQFIGRGPRMCSHSALPPAQRAVTLHMYGAVFRPGDPRLGPEEDTDIWLLRTSQTEYKRFLQPLTAAFESCAWDKDFFKTTHENVNELISDLLKKKFESPDKIAPKKTTLSKKTAVPTEGETVFASKEEAEALILANVNVRDALRAIFDKILPTRGQFKERNDQIFQDLFDHLKRLYSLDEVSVKFQRDMRMKKENPGSKEERWSYVFTVSLGPNPKHSFVIKTNLKRSTLFELKRLVRGTLLKMWTNVPKEGIDLYTNVKNAEIVALIHNISLPQQLEELEKSKGLGCPEGYAETIFQGSKVCEKTEEGSNCDRKDRVLVRSATSKMKLLECPKCPDDKFKRTEKTQDGRSVERCYENDPTECDSKKFTRKANGIYHCNNSTHVPTLFTIPGIDKVLETSNKRTQSLVSRESLDSVFFKRKKSISLPSNVPLKTRAGQIENKELFPVDVGTKGRLEATLQALSHVYRSVDGKEEKTKLVEGLSEDEKEEIQLYISETGVVVVESEGVVSSDLKPNSILLFHDKDVDEWTPLRYKDKYVINNLQKLKVETPRSETKKKKRKGSVAPGDENLKKTRKAKKPKPLLATGDEAPAVLVTGDEALSVLPTGDKAPSALPTGDEAPAALPTGDKAPTPEPDEVVRLLRGDSVPSPSASPLHPSVGSTSSRPSPQRSVSSVSSKGTLVEGSDGSPLSSVSSTQSRSDDSHTEVEESDSSDVETNNDPRPPSSRKSPNKGSPTSPGTALSQSRKSSPERRSPGKGKGSRTKGKSPPEVVEIIDSSPEQSPSPKKGKGSPARSVSSQKSSLSPGSRRKPLVPVAPKKINTMMEVGLVYKLKHDLLQMSKAQLQEGVAECEKQKQEFEKTVTKPSTFEEVATKTENDLKMVAYQQLLQDALNGKVYQNDDNEFESSATGEAVRMYTKFHVKVQHGIIHGLGTLRDFLASEKPNKRDSPKPHKISPTPARGKGANVREQVEAMYLERYPALPYQAILEREKTISRNAARTKHSGKAAAFVVKDSFERDVATFRRMTRAEIRSAIANCIELRKQFCPTVDKVRNKNGKCVPRPHKSPITFEEEKTVTMLDLERDAYEKMVEDFNSGNTFEGEEEDDPDTVSSAAIRRYLGFKEELEDGDLQTRADIEAFRERFIEDSPAQKNADWNRSSPEEEMDSTGESSPSSERSGSSTNATRRNMGKHYPTGKSIAALQALRKESKTLDSETSESPKRPHPSESRKYARPFGKKVPPQVRYGQKVRPPAPSSPKKTSPQTKKKGTKKPMSFRDWVMKKSRKIP
jgi:hypothetical protein